MGFYSFAHNSPSFNYLHGQLSDGYYEFSNESVKLRMGPRFAQNTTHWFTEIRTGKLSVRRLFLTPTI